MKAQVSKPDSPPLLPAGKHHLSLAELEELAVVPFSSEGPRSALFNDLTSLVQRLSTFGIKCELWVDGSFLTEKPDPADIDLTIVIGRVDFDLMPSAMKNQVIMLCSKSHPLNASLDCYIVDNGDQSRLAYWDIMWGSDRDNAPKGYIVLDIPVQNV